MRKILLIAALAVIVLVGGGLTVLATWNIPAPTQPIEKVISNDRFTF